MLTQRLEQIKSQDSTPNLCRFLVLAEVHVGNIAHVDRKGILDQSTSHAVMPACPDSEVDALVDA